MKTLMKVAMSMVAMLAMTLTGCGSTPTTPADAGDPAMNGGHGEHAGDTDHGGGVSAMDKMKTELAKLSPEDAASAEKQHMCPVSGEMLGSMGAPKKYEVSGQQVWICCDGCKKSLLEKPDEYLAKLKKE